MSPSHVVTEHSPSSAGPPSLSRQAFFAPGAPTMSRRLGSVPVFLIALDSGTLLGAGWLFCGLLSSLTCLTCSSDGTEVRYSWRHCPQMTHPLSVSVRVRSVHTPCPSKWNLDQGSTRFSTEKLSWVTISSVGERHFETNKYDDPA